MIPNAAEIRKFSVLSLGWLVTIFVAVWGACWTVGVLIPALLANSSFDFAGMTVEICRAITPLVAVMVFIPINAMFMVLLERRALALFTRRRGPNRVGPDGALQTAADAVKLLLKEDITPTGADALMFTLAPIVFFAPSIFGAIPLLAAVTNNNKLFQITDLPTGIFFVLAASSIPVVGIVMGGWASNNKYSLLGGLRSAAQAISYEIPLVLSIITICLLAGSLDVVTIAKQQSGGILNWNILGGGALTGLSKAVVALISPSGPAMSEVMQTYYPYGWLSLVGVLVLCVSTIILFGIYLTGACAEINRIPFDLPEAESELVSGYNTEYSGIKFAIFFLAEFTNLFIVSTIAVVMFLGGGDCPLPPWLNPLSYPAVYEPLTRIFSPVLSVLIDRLHIINPDTFWPALWAIIKTYSIIVFAVLVRGTLPRFRIDQLLDFGWKRLVPITLGVFILVAFARGVINFHV